MPSDSDADELPPVRARRRRLAPKRSESPSEDTEEIGRWEGEGGSAYWQGPPSTHVLSASVTHD